MKCTNCHTHLPEFGRFQKKVCPNCGNPVAVVNTVPTTPKTAPKTHNVTDYALLKAEKARDAVVWDMLIGLLFLFMIIVSFSLIERKGSNLPYLVFLLGVVGSGITTLLLPYLLLRAFHLQRLVPKFLRPDFRPVFGLLIIGFISAILTFALSFSIHQRIEYAQNEPRFVEVEATITQIVKSGTGDDVDYDVYISYDFDEKTHVIEYPKHNSSMHEGDPISITIDPEDPEKLPQKGTGIIIVTAILTSINLGVLYLIIIQPLIIRAKKRKHTYI